GVEFTVEETKDGRAIRYALAAVKGVGAQAMASILAERAAHGRFTNLFDFARRIDAKSFNRRQFENLVKAGAFDGLNPNRAQSFAACDLLLRHASAAAEERASTQVSLFEGMEAAAHRPALPVVADWPSIERLQNEFDAIGFYLSAHPLDAYGKSLERIGVVRVADLPARLAAAGGPSRHKLAGIVVAKKERTSARGSRFAFVQMSDSSGLYELTVFSEVLGQARPLLDGGQPLLVTVDCRIEEEALRLTTQRIEPLDAVVAHAAAGLRVFVGEPAALKPLKGIIGREGPGRGRVTIVVGLEPAREVEIALPGAFKIGPGLRAAVKSLPGVLDVHDV
ncbi:MAG: DNA polymerase III subunit alpha, partial [Alphaproteobacteria bacterium]|nr:DNA polymerase III subunit alpha [Alphaproteobacteria bacterium]